MKKAFVIVVVAVVLVMSASGCLMDSAMSYVKQQGKEWVNDPAKVAAGKALFLTQAGSAYDKAIEKAKEALNSEAVVAK
jgi:hypothetical protein